MNATRTIEFRGIEFDVEFDYTPYRSATHLSPAEGGDVDLLSISVAGYEMSALLSDWAVEHIRYEVEALIPEIMTEEIIAAAEAREDERRESCYFA